MTDIEMVTEHFSREELECPCCGEMKIEPIILLNLERVRWEVSEPLPVESGYRCEERNREVGGVPNSRHTRGQAFDIKVSSVVASDLVAAAPLHGFFGIGVKRLAPNLNMIHLDARPYDLRRLWGYL